jgi:hypothetical protein
MIYLALLTYRDSPNPGALVIEAPDHATAALELHRWREEDPIITHKVVWGPIGNLLNLDGKRFVDMLRVHL